MKRIKVESIASQSEGSISIGPFGSALKADVYTDSGVPVIRGKDINNGIYIGTDDLVFVSPETADRLKRSIVRKDDLVFPHRGSIGAVGLIPEGEFLMSSSMMKLTVDKTKVDPKFLLYYFRGPGHRELMSRASTVGTPGIAQPLSSLRSIPILIPGLTAQRAIADVLGALDDKITINAKLADKSDALICLQFKAALQRSTPTQKPFLDVFHVEFGEAFKGDKFAEPGIGRPLIRIRDLKTFSSQVWTTESRSKETIVIAGDVVVGMDAEFRATTWLGEPGLLNQRVCRVTSHLGNSAFVREALRQPLSTIENYKTATTVIHLNKKDLEETSVLVPPKDAIDFFQSTSDNLYRSRVALAAENRILALTRDSLLPQLMSGRLRVKDAEALVESLV